MPKKTRIHREKALCEALLESEGWGKIAPCYAFSLPFPRTVQEFYHLFWTVNGFNIRRQVGDDKILVEMLRNMLPAYSGGPMGLYRGEGGDAWSQGKIGLCWTPNIDCAKLFASGTNCDKNSGGYLLRCHAPTNAIIAGPSSHSQNLEEGEYTVDPSRLSDVKALQRISWDETGNVIAVENL